MLNEKQILELMHQNEEEIQSYGVKRIGLFGSYVNNTQKSSSDIDILVEFKKGQKTFDNYMDLKFFLEDIFNQNVDLVVKEAIKLQLRSNILKSVKYAT